MTSLRNVDTILSRGGVCILPTETVYGVAGRADRRDVIDRIYAAKGRSFDKPLALCVRNLKMAERYGRISPLAQDLAAMFWPGPLTLVVSALTTDLDERLYGADAEGNPTLALRCPDVTWARTMGSLPFALTSANRSGDKETHTAGDASRSIGEFVDGVLDQGTSTLRAASTILAVKENKAILLRAGALAAEDFAAVPVEWV